MSNIELYSFYKSFYDEQHFNEFYDSLSQTQKYYYFPTFDHYLDAQNMSQGLPPGSTYAPDVL